jgi:hypothetical protein
MIVKQETPTPTGFDPLGLMTQFPGFALALLLHAEFAPSNIQTSRYVRRDSE